MQDKSQMQASQSYQQEQHPQIRYFKNSLLAPNVIPKLCSELTSTEILDDTVEKYLDEMCNHFTTTTFESACYLAKHKNTDKVDVSDFASAIYENFGIYEPSSNTSAINQMNINNLKSQSTSDHQKRLELTKEETKNVNV